MTRSMLRQDMIVLLAHAKTHVRITPPHCSRYASDVLVSPACSTSDFLGSLGSSLVGVTTSEVSEPWTMILGTPKVSFEGLSEL